MQKTLGKHLDQNSVSELVGLTANISHANIVVNYKEI